MLQVFTSSFGLWFGQENKGITSGLHPEVNTNQVIPDRRNKATHLVKLVLITDTLLIIIAFMIIISHSKQVLCIHVSQKHFSKFSIRIYFIYLFGGGRSLLLEEQTKGLSVSLVPCYWIAVVDLEPSFSLLIIGLNHDFILFYFILFYFILFLGGLEGGKYIYESNLLNKQGSLEFKLKWREHVTLKYFVLVRRNWAPFQMRLGSEEKPLQGV